MPERRPMVLEPLRRTADDAREFAEIVHAEQRDKADRPYVHHLEDVHERLLLTMPPEWDGVVADEARQIAWLHDVIEDTELTADDLADEGFSNAVIVAVSDLTKPKWQSYGDYIRDLARSDDLPTILVKIADVEDNSDPARLALLPAETRARLEKKYGAALPVLKAAAERLGWVLPPATSPLP